MARPFTAAQIDDALAGLSGWAAADDGRAIRRKYRFEGFGEAFAFMTRAALAAEKADHHPEWSNVYDRVDVTLTTHDAGGVTDKDIALATLMNAAAGDA